ncbi:MAG: DUF2095 family protein [Promethearchaeota archaeon]
MDSKKRLKSPLQTKDNLTVEYDREDFHKSFPHLVEELETKNSLSGIEIEGVSYNNMEPEDPTLIDFILRCSTVEEVMEILNYLEKRNEITSIEADRTRKQIESEGLASFGPRRASNYYEQVFRKKNVTK